jgi:phosphatidylglycerol lysyltransferase
MGLVPLSTPTWLPANDNPLWLRLLLTWVRAHGRRFYNFDGLEAFKSKFQPHGWEPIYAIVNARRFTPGTLYAIAAAFSGGSPVLAVARGLWKALREEAGRIRKLRPDAQCVDTPSILL